MIEIIIGTILVLLVLHDVFQTIVVPRASTLAFRIVPILVRNFMWPAYRSFVNIPSLKEWKEDLLAVFAPGAFALVMLIWLFLLMLGYALILYGLWLDIKPVTHSFVQSFYLAGASILTAGAGDVTAFGIKARLTILIAAISGLSFMALEVSYLFTLQSLVQQREQVVNTVISRAGAPASGLVLLLRYRELGIVDSLSNSFLVWESWIANILESHRAYPFLLLFRSTNQTESWISVLGAMLDTASLLTTSIKDVKIGEAELFYWLACSTVQSLCKTLSIPVNDSVRLTFKEFQDGLHLLQETGYEVDEPEHAWRLFKIRKQAYDGYLRALADAFESHESAWLYDLKIANLPEEERLRDSIFQAKV